jgi:hypothetical protein
MKYINLYQAAFHPPRVILPARRLLAGGALFLIALVAIYAWGAWRLASLRREVSQLTVRADRLDARVKAGNVVRQADPRVEAEATQVESRLHNLQLAQEAVANGALGSPTGYAAQFRALARVRAAGAWLTRIEIDAGGHEMNLYGRALSGEASAHLIAGLRREPLFIGLSFASLAVTPAREKAAEGDAAKTHAATPPRFLEFALSARQPKEPKESAAPGGAPATGMPPQVSLPELLAKQAAQAKTPSTP